MNWNTVILTLGIGLASWASEQVYKEIRLTHDAVIKIETKMVSREEFDLRLAELKARISEMDIEIQKIKDKNNM